jgi:hypothetical protein
MSDEELLRRGLRDLAQGEAPAAGGPSVVESVVSRGRRTRARRRVSAAGCAALLIAGGMGLGLRSADQAPRTPDSVASTATSTADQPLQLGPATPKIGIKYKYDLVTSCELRFAIFGDGKWVSTMKPSFTGSIATDRVSGYMTLISKDTARFEFSSGSPGRTITFQPASGGGHCPVLPPPNPAKPPVLEQSPTKAREGIWYPHDLHVHCGVRYTGFDGREWKTVRPYSEAETGLGGMRGFALVSGFMKMSGDRLRFELADGGPIEFRPTAPGEEPPGCA